MKEGNILNCPRGYSKILSFTDSHPTPGTVDLDFRLDMNQLLELHKLPTELENVEGVSQPPMVS